MPVPYSSLFFQNQPVLNEFHPTKQRFSGTTLTETLPIISSALPQVSGFKRAHYSGHLPELQTNKDVASHFDFCGVSSGFPLARSTLTEDDFLEMSYEEYLEEVHSRGRKQLRISATKSS
ncbi:unnamed protein product [Sphenostylis stenocarpa]|uniref:Uncharacterized protein n=1 Tax=Sphenostylis stenocarpa TaxID=92480 RepID=A0AA86VBF3_9FABA|nr:unnamed protein product [Sphenostylis stenocarpa]